MKGRGHSFRTGDYHPSTRHDLMPQVDLHGLRHHIAETRLELFLKDQMKNGEDSVLVIHGHGTGVLRDLVTDWIEKNQHMVADYQPRNNGGAMYIRFSRR
ncbi:MAG: Smr/MutS family protein [Candidatus Uhrbacteria bacterium]